MNSWSMYVDVEGFSNIFLKDKSRGIWLLRELMYDIYKVGSRLYKDERNRLFVYQSGDGFVVIPDFEKETERPISLAIALLQSMLARGGSAKAAISFGRMVDILGCYPGEIVKQSKDGIINIGEGILVFNQVMGDALINSYKLGNKVSGPLLVVTDEVLNNARDCNFVVYHVEGSPCPCINWIYSKTPLVNDILDAIGGPILSEDELKQKLETYLLNDGLSKQWIENAKRLIKSRIENNTILD